MSRTRGGRDGGKNKEREPGLTFPRGFPVHKQDKTKTEHIEKKQKKAKEGCAEKNKRRENKPKLILPKGFPVQKQD